MVTNGVSVTNLPKTINQFFDPAVEFLELAETDNGITSWKIYGPDANGIYGGLNGIGGLDAVCTFGQYASPIFGDVRGNGYAVYQQFSLNWYPSRVTGYGAVPNYRPLSLGNGAELAQASAWHGRWADITGYIWNGARTINPIAGNWLSADPRGHASDPGLDTLCGYADPINAVDADGRITTPFAGMADRDNPASSSYQPTYSGPSISAVSPQSSSYDSAFRVGDAAGSFADGIFNMALSATLYNDITVDPGSGTPEAQYQNAMANVALRNFGSPIAQTGVYNPNSSGGVVGTVIADVAPIATTFYGGMRTTTGGTSPAAAPFPEFDYLFAGLDNSGSLPRTITLNSTAYPASAANLQEAGAINTPLPVNRAAAAANRAAALRGLPKIPGYDLDESPPAMFRNPEDPVIVRPIAPADNRGSGASLGNQASGVPDGEYIIIQLEQNGQN
jgi:hypothetical protein